MYSFTESEEAGDEMTLQDMVALQSVTMNQLQQQVESLKNDSAVLKAASKVQQAELAELKQKVGVSGQILPFVNINYIACFPFLLLV